MEKEKEEVSVRTTKKHLRVTVARAKRHHKQSPGMEWEGDDHHQPSVCVFECEGEKESANLVLLSLGTTPEVPTLSLLSRQKSEMQLNLRTRTVIL